MENYIIIFVTLIATIIAIKGGTWDAKKKGSRRITKTGVIALVIAIIGFIASIVANIKSEEEKQASNKQLSDYQNALEHIDSSTKVIEGRTERQLQQVMAQLVVINPMEKWHAPNYAYPGSVIEIYNVASSTILEIRAVNDDFKLDIFCPEREFAKGIFYGESGKKIEWTVRSSEFFKGKIFLLSSPRTRDSKFSWEEEKITQ